MTKRRLLRWSLILVILAAFAVWLEPTRVVWGWLRGEAFYQGRPTSYWAERIRPWDSYCEFGGDGGLVVRIRYCYVPNTGAAQRWLINHVGLPPPPWPSILDGDPNAEPVLRELLDDSSDLIRQWAVEGLDRIQTQERGPVIWVTYALDNKEPFFDRATADRSLPGRDGGVESEALVP
jgi:hypothetical protein